MTHRIQTSRLADADIDRTVERICDRATTLSAAQWHDGLLRRLRLLAARPEMWPLADEAEEVGLELREMLYRRHRFVYRILYTIEKDDVVYIHRIRSAAQDRLRPDDL